MGTVVNFFRSAILIAFALTLLVALEAQAAICIDKDTQTDANLPPFADDDYFDLQIRSVQEGSTVRVTGDTVIVDEKRMASLVSTPSYAKTKLSPLFPQVHFGPFILSVTCPNSAPAPCSPI